ncbi:MAG: hypothetical protein M3P95_12360 [Actinomycetota bacterium]|nr:hypothetical protein [Actinomycetota bacterium]
MGERDSTGRHGAARRQWLIAVASRPRWLLPVLAAVLLVAGLAGSGLTSALALVAVAGLLAWLASHSWPVIDPQGRLLRVAAVVVLLAVAVTRLR